MATEPIPLTVSSEDDEEPDDFSPLAMSTELTQHLKSDDASLKLFDKSIDELNVVDVYNIASSIGQEFERLTDAFGGAVFCGVMPKIIRILELLESLVTKKEEEAAEIVELNDSLHKLQVESQLKDRKKQEEIEVIESTWKDETRGLLETVSTLEEDNQKLTLLVTENLREESADAIAVPEQQALVTKLQQQISQQRDQIRGRNASLDERSQEIDALQLQIQRLTKLNSDVRSKMYIFEQQAKRLIEEKANLEAKLNSSGQKMAELQLKSLKKQKSVEEQIKFAADQNDDGTLSALDPLVANKLVIDLNDPNRPRYTLEELQEVLTDRNQLKARCFLLEEELMYHRGEDTWVELDEDEIKQSKLNSLKQSSQPAQESGIRRFFHYLAGDSSRRSQVEPSKSQQSHKIVDDEISARDLINPDHIKELVPDTNRKRDVIEAEENASPPVCSEMITLSPTFERDDLSP